MDFDRLRRNWENLGRADPMWAILTEEGTEGGGWDEEAFFATGRDFVEWLGAWLGRHGIPPPEARPSTSAAASGGSPRRWPRTSGTSPVST